MTKRTLYTASLAALMIVLLAGCEGTVSRPDPVQRTQVLLAPQVYGAFRGAATKGELGTGYNDFDEVPALTTLPIGSTVWLTYRKGTPVEGATDLGDPDNFTWSETSLQAYVVLNSAGYNALYPCKSTEEDGYLTVNTPLDYTNPLYLKDGYYQFRMVSPANKIRKSDLSMQVDNGMYVYANDERYTQTSSSIIEIKSNGTGVQNIVLNPMINETARIKVTLTPGANVSKMEMMSQGIEISGLQNPETEGGELAFKWSSMDLKDTLVMKKGAKYSRTYIKDFESDGEAIVGEIGVLPTDARSTLTVLLINLAVNGIPTQYLVTLSQMRYIHGHSYNLDLQVGLDGDIQVMSWANQSWSGNVNF